jgi:hypothetical protein
MLDMKIPLFVSFLALVTTTLAASVADVDQAIVVTTATPSSTASLLLEPAGSSLIMVTDATDLREMAADSMANPTQLLASQTAVSVPESAGAAFLALFGYVLILRRRTS